MFFHETFVIPDFSLYGDKVIEKLISYLECLFILLKL